MTPAKQHSRGHRNIIATSARHQQSITKTRPRHHRDTPRHHPSNTKPRLTQRRQDRDTAETCPRAWIFRSWSIIRRRMGHSYAQRCTVYKNWNLRFCLETHHHQKIKTPSPKQKKQHCNINDTTPSHHPLIIINITAPSPHITETSPNMPETSPKKNRDKTETRPRDDRDMTETSQKHHQNNTETSRSQHRDKTRPRQHHNNTETSPKKDRDKTETRPRHHRDITTTTPRHHPKKTETRPRHDRDITETRPRQHQNNTKTSPKKTETRPRHDRDIRDILGEFFSGACAAPGRLIHVRPQAYRYWGIKQLVLGGNMAISAPSGRKWQK